MTPNPTDSGNDVCRACDIRRKDHGEDGRLTRTVFVNGKYYQGTHSFVEPKVYGAPLSTFADDIITILRG